ncbi:MAG: putative acyl-CoA dehydrogenase [Candidatus Tokpelaia sp. JSC189]|nr:MAG: putative acyl-CoA dehydrogenase [Candidatus Tokpelaia sp. JSC189]
MGAHKLNMREKNSFFGDPILFQIASTFHASLVPELADLGAYTASDDAHEKARLVGSWTPRPCFYDAWGNHAENIDVHPAYYSLLIRSRHAGISNSLFTEGGKESDVRHQVRAVRLFLLAGLENGHLEELCSSSAGFHVLKENADLFSQWNPLITDVVHGPSCKHFQQRHSISLALALEENDMNAASLPVSFAELMYVDLQTKHDLYKISGYKLAVINPVADGFIVSAAFEGKLSMFFVPRLLAKGQINSISLVSAWEEKKNFSVPYCHVRFEQSVGWMIGFPDMGNKLLTRIRQDLEFDHAVIIAGMIRSILHYTVTYMRYNTHQQPAKILAERALADAALDGAAASVLVLRLAKAQDLAANNLQEAAFAAIMRPAIHYWLLHILGQITDYAISLTGSYNIFLGGIFSRAQELKNRNFSFEGTTLHLVLDIVNTIKQIPDLFQAVIAMPGNENSAIDARTTEILRVVADMVLNKDEGTIFLLVEQLIYAFASVGLRALDCDIVATAYVESRLGGQWRSTYGILGPHYNASFILDALYPLNYKRAF